MTTTIIEARVTIAAEAERVFRAITDPAELERWLGDAATAARGHAVLEPERRVEFHWELGGRETVAAIEVRPAEGATEVLVEHRGVTERQDGDASVRDFWVLALENLRGHVEHGDIAARPGFISSRGDVRLEVGANAPAERVFEALTQPTELDRWIGDGAAVEPRVGGRYDFGWDHGPIKILDLEPGRRLSYSWSYPDEAGRTLADETVVEWTLEESGGRTRIVLVHSGFAPDGQTDDYHLGWLAFLALLKNLVEGGPSWTAATAATRVAEGASHRG
jgi:uncharacterized protein YndB with AHSA1/START domain